MTTVLPLRGLKLGVRVVLFVSALGLVLGGALAQQIPLFGPPKKQQKRAAELIRRQEPPMVIPRVLERATPDNVSIYISWASNALTSGSTRKSPLISISSGKRAGMTPPGNYRILEKDADHRSNIYGDFVNPRTGRVVRAGISTRIDSAPSGTVYRGAPMRWFMRLSPAGVGMHTGILPGYPASHGCIRMPEELPSFFRPRKDRNSGDNRRLIKSVAGGDTGARICPSPVRHVATITRSNRARVLCFDGMTIFFIVFPMQLSMRTDYALRALFTLVETPWRTSYSDHGVGQAQ